MTGRLNRAMFRQIGFALGTLVALATLFFVSGLRINVTPSIPLGLYIRTGTPPTPGLIAEFCPSEMGAIESKRYRGFGLTCPDRSIPLLKPVVATSGDKVRFSPAGLMVNGHPLANTAPRLFDGKRRTIHPWPSGTYTVEVGEIVVASTYHPGSYDSRYLGPISLEDVKGMLRPLWLLRW